MSDRIGSGSHPNRPLPSQEVIYAADREFLALGAEYSFAVLQGIEDVVNLTGRTVEFDDLLMGQAGALSTLENHLLNERGQVDADKLYSTLVANDFSDPEHPVFIMLSKDLAAANTNFIFGFSVKEVGLSVQSAARFTESISDKRLLQTTLRHIARHEYGHLVGLDTSSIRNQDTRGGLCRGHCANECTMQQVMSVPEAAKLAHKLSTKPHAGFCADCAGILALKGK